MNARAVNAAAAITPAAMEQGRQTPAGLALALDSAGLLNSPEHAAEFGRMRSLLAGQREQVSAAVEVSKDESGTTVEITPVRMPEAGGAS